ncbi:hypothetical protein NXS19_004672 [Fusarium pseudograminearum]|nr:hypothetical protein NXS19_004672 [Fusarium pseudograminearum]
MEDEKSFITPQNDRRITRSMIKKETEYLKARTTDNTQTILKSSRRKKTGPKSSEIMFSAARIPTIRAPRFGLIQETLSTDLYALLVATALWNRTRGTQARPVFDKLISKYPTPTRLAVASFVDLAELIRPIGLYNLRAARFIAFANAWIENPPCKEKRYRKLHYPMKGDGKDVGKDEVLDEDDERQGWEVAHLPSLGPYAIDSYRIFHRDMLRGLAKDWKGAKAEPGFEPEWKRVVPLDKELRAFLRWMWLKEGWIWDPETGHKVKASAERMERERLRTRSLSPEGFRVVRGG